MRRLLRWILVLGVAAGLVWACATVEIGHRTPFGHLSSWAMRSRTVRNAVAWAKQRLGGKPGEEKLRAKPKGPAKAAVEEQATERRVVLLEKAAKALDASVPSEGHTSAS